MNKYKALRYLYLVIFLISFSVPYFIQFKLNFLGATLVTLKDIIGLWIMTPIIAFFILIVPFVNNEEKIKNERRIHNH